MPEQASNRKGQKPDAPQDPGCGALAAFSMVVTLVGSAAFLMAAISGFNAWWNSPAETAAGDLAFVVAVGCLILLLLGWVGHGVARRWMYRWSTLLVVLAVFGLGSWFFGREYRALVRAERAAQVLEQGRYTTP
ncbi:hypothetical protein GO986_21955 [Deinococcus sp. HMF7620]|uniref:Uncharacterized protein n=1 Tax=Deinococcus arboris TaxID=2682977 RepID=A0A7C9LTW5_9DEIO|nr:MULTISPECIES: hypothetical protein [Deinococcus]MBZ9752834.1 hypothetical protein [Deinococcus betulae]MVN89401.1 hypothetical protein [Deinococcus arboris]